MLACLTAVQGLDQCRGAGGDKVVEDVCHILDEAGGEAVPALHKHSVVAWPEVQWADGTAADVQSADGTAATVADEGLVPAPWGRGPQQQAS